MKPTEFAVMLTTLGEIFDKRVTSQMADIYYSILQEYPDDRVQEAFLRAATDCKFFPRPSELLRFIMKMTSTDAHQIVTDAMRTAGAYESVAFPEPINAVIEAMGGWAHICKLKADEWHGFKKKEFCQTFEDYRTKGMRAGYYLPGITEVDNVARKLPRPQVKRFGFEFKQKKIEEKTEGNDEQKKT